MSRRPVVIDDQMLRAIFTRPKPSDTRPFLTRLLASLRFVVRGDFRRGITFLGMTGKADF
jgi:hypothetical protein